MKKILLLEDDSQISKSLKIGLTLEGFEVTTAGTLSEANQKMELGAYDVFLFDVNLPDGNGIDLCHQIRSAGNETPVLFLSARTDEETVVRGMSIGADDYLRKPFGLEELKIRMKNAMKRVPPSRQILEMGLLQIGVAGRTAKVKGLPLNLGRREFDILSSLLKKKGDVVTREDIIAYLGEAAELFDRTVDSHISHLRRKLREGAGEAVQIVPVYGVGYRLHALPESAS